MILRVLNRDIEIRDITNHEKIWQGFRTTEAKRKQQEVSKLEKRRKSGIRKCPGHKGNIAFYSGEDNICSVCKGQKQTIKK